MNIFEALMLICFGVSWPISVYKTLKTKQVAGKSRLFMIVVLSGYICGMIYKITGNFDWVFGLYLFNFCMVAVDLTLCHIYKTNPPKLPDNS